MNELYANADLYDKESDHLSQFEKSNEEDEKILSDKAFADLSDEYKPLFLFIKKIFK